MCKILLRENGEKLFLGLENTQKEPTHTPVLKRTGPQLLLSFYYSSIAAAMILFFYSASPHKYKNTL